MEKTESTYKRKIKCTVDIRLKFWCGKNLETAGVQIKHSFGHRNQKLLPEVRAWLNRISRTWKGCGGGGWIG